MRFQNIPPPIPPIPQQPTTTHLVQSFPPPSFPVLDPSLLANLQAKLAALKEQISQSERNLSGQDEFLNKQKRVKVEEALKSIVNDKLQLLKKESSIDFGQFEKLTNKIVQVCTKDAISSGRNFVFHNNLNERHFETICYYLTQRIIDKDSSNDARLHLIYFMNDLVHYG